MKTKSLNIGIVQSNPIVGDITGNTVLAIEQIKSLKKEAKPDLIVFSEMFITAYPPEDLLLRNDLLLEVDTAINEISKIAPDTYIVIGYPCKRKKKLFNAAGIIFNGELIGEYYKQELPNYSVFDEKRYFSPGKGPVILEIDDFKIGITICEDMWHTKSIRQAVSRGANLIVNLNASPFDKNKTMERVKLLEDRTKRFNVPIVYVNQVGGQDELVFDGTSMVFSADSKCRLILPSFKVCSKNIEFVRKSKKIEILTESKLHKISDIQNIYDALVLGTKDYVKKNGFPGAIIGSSGGIDSALTAAIAVDALGPKKVKTFMMPFKYTSEISLIDASLLAKNLGIKHQVVPIEDIYNSFIKGLKPEFKNKPIDKTEENLQSRCRGVLLMGISNKSGALVLTTGNKSETAVGYSTLYGDTAGGFCVLKDVSKTLVYELSNYRNSISQVIPQRIIDRPPSAELAADQKDSDSLPDYSILDKIIELYVENDLGFQQIVNKGFDPIVVKSILKLIDLSEYKRRQAPIGIKISDKGFGKDRRYPITNKWTL